MVWLSSISEATWLSKQEGDTFLLQKIHYYTEVAATSVSILFLNWEILVIYSQSTAPKILILNPLKV